MVKVFRVSLVFILIIFLLTNCKKEYSYEGGPVIDLPASYTLVSEGNLCTGNISGAYTAAIPLDADDTYTLTVNVSAPGQYAISTQTVNGITFNHSGTFTSTGMQTVTLSGYGKPGIIGVFTLRPEIIGQHVPGGQGCDFMVGVK
jgi:hypothetical protein